MQAHQKEVQASLEKHGLRTALFVAFPQPTPPRIGLFGVWLVNRFGGRIMTKYQVVNGTITNKSKNRRS